MRLLQRMCFVVLASGLALGQATASNSGSAGSTSVADELKALRDAISQQQQQIAQQQQQIQTLQNQLGDKGAVKQQAVSSSSNDTRVQDNTPRVVNASLNTTPVSTTMVQETEKKESPLSFRIGGMDFTPGGFVDFQNIFRTENTGSVVSTAFGSIPFSNTAAGHLTEFRSTGQYSRWNMKIGGKYGANNITGYVEGDFNGNDAANVFATTNPHTLRLRLFFADIKRGQWEVSAGQMWSLITPNRVGTSMMPSDLATTQATDGNIHVGVAYSRDGQFRVTYRPSDHFSWAIATDNPQQYTNGEVIAPTAFNAVLATQLDGSVTTGVPNLIPDLMTKMAYDTKVGDHAFHVEAGALATSVKVTAIDTGAITFSSHHSFGEGVMGGVNLELAKGFRVMAYGTTGTGIGRYMIGFGPQYVVAPIATGPATFTIDTSMVHASSGYGGFELQHGKTQIGAYYGGFYFGRNAFNDLTAAATATPISCAPGLAAINRPCIGFGGTNSANSNNRAIQEGSFVLTQTLWRNPQYGALQLINDASYSTRAPWFVAAGAPKNAHMFMDHLVLRYVIP